MWDGWLLSRWGSPHGLEAPTSQPMSDPGGQYVDQLIEGGRGGGGSHSGERGGGGGSPEIMPAVGWDQIPSDTG